MADYNIIFDDSPHIRTHPTRVCIRSLRSGTNYTITQKKAFLKYVKRSYSRGFTARKTAGLRRFSQKGVPTGCPLQESR